MAVKGKFRPLKSIVKKTSKKLVKKINENSELTKDEVLIRIKYQFEKGNIDPADLFIHKESQNNNTSEAIFQVGFVGLKDELTGFITVSFVPKGKVIYSPYVIFQQTYSDYAFFIKQDSWGKYWHKRYYEKTNYKQINTEILPATEVINFLEKAKTNSFNFNNVLVTKTLQKLILESSGIQQLKKMKKNKRMSKELRKSITIAKKLK